MLTERMTEQTLSKVDNSALNDSIVCFQIPPCYPLEMFPIVTAQVTETNTAGCVLL